jgi:hypothetical protein
MAEITHLPSVITISHSIFEVLTFLSFPQVKRKIYIRNVIHYGEGREEAFTALTNTVNVQSKILVYTSSSSKYRYIHDILACSKSLYYKKGTILQQLMISLLF